MNALKRIGELALNRLKHGPVDPTRRVVGTDKRGNVYTETGEERRRQVEYVDDDLTIPPLWWSWIRRLKEEAPTAEDFERFEWQQQDLKEKVAKLEKKDAKIRLEQLAQMQRDGTMDEGAPQAGMIETIMENINREEGNSAPFSDSPRHASPPMGNGQHRSTPPPPPRPSSSQAPPVSDPLKDFFASENKKIEDMSIMADFSPVEQGSGEVEVGRGMSPVGGGGGPDAAKPFFQSTNATTSRAAVPSAGTPPPSSSSSSRGESAPKTQSRPSTSRSRHRDRLSNVDLDDL